MIFVGPLAAAMALTLSAITGVLASPGRADAQGATRSARIGFLNPTGMTASDELERAFFSRLRDLGWIEGQNLTVVIRRADGKAEALLTLASELVQRQVDVIVTSGTTAIRAARQATDRVPIVMAGGGDPVATGLVKTLARPGGNITGISLLGQEMVPKSLSFLRETLPRVKRVDLLANAANPANAFFARAMAEAAQALGVETRLLEVRRPDELASVIAGTKADALLMLADPMFFLHAKRIADSAIQRGLPLFALGRPYVEAGSLMSYGLDFPDVFRRAADYADRILRGANPAELPVEQPSRYELIFNLRTARRLGLTVPRSLLFRADQVLE